MIIDTHQHLWDTAKHKPAWLEEGGPLYAEYLTPQYLQEMKGLNVKAVYMEVDVTADKKADEAEYVIGLCRAKTNPTIAAVIGGHPDGPTFRDYIKRFNSTGYLRGVRQVLHSKETPAGTAVKEDFLKGLQFLGEQGLLFDLCMRAVELPDGGKVADRCPDTQFILDHCGNADPKAFMKNPPADAPPEHEAGQWKKDMEALAKRPNIACKISGIVARATPDWNADQLAPIVNHCLDVFGPDRVVFGSDWPICLGRTHPANWIAALKEIIASRPEAEQQRLWSGNAKRIYKLDV